MGRHKTPLKVLRIRGADKKNPARMRERENEPENVADIGKPSKYLNRLQRLFFRELVSVSIPGVLGKADRIAVEQAAVLLWKLRGFNVENGFVVDPTVSEQQLFTKYLGQFGMLPCDRSKISIDKPKKPNPFAD